MKSLFTYLTVILLSVTLIGCSRVPKLEYWQPEKPSSEYYLLLAGGSLNIGSEFKDVNNLFDVISVDEKNNVIQYKQKLGMFDFKTTNGIITEITTASPDVLLCSKYCVGMTKAQILNINNSFMIAEYKDRFLFLDNSTGCTLETKFDDKEKSTIMRISCLRVRE